LPRFAGAKKGDIMELTFESTLTEMIEDLETTYYFEDEDEKLNKEN
jgi:hypothetical protein